MPRPRFDRLDPEKKAAILEAAAREFGTKGFDNASLNQILINAGFSKGAAYYYFDDKADLFLAAIGSFLKEFETKLDFSRFTTGNFWAVIGDLYSTGQEMVKDKPWIIGLSKAIWKMSPAARQNEILRGVYSTARDWVGKIMSRGQELGCVRADLPMDLILDLFFAIDEAHDRWFMSQLESGDPDIFESARTRLLELLKRVFEPAGEEA